MKAESILKYLALWIYPPKCMICSEIIPLKEAKLLCKACKEEMDMVSGLFCCRPPRQIYFEEGRALVRYQGSIIRTLRKIKYQGRSDYARELGILMGHKLNELFDESIDMIIPVPLHATREKERGYNQSEIIALEISRHTSIPIYRNVITRVKHTEAQYKLTHAQRQKNISGAFSFNTDIDINDKNILLVDDIYTSGSTVNECAKVLQASNPSRIFVYAFALA